MSPTRITARAPGKMVLAGEYAVLEGYPALVAAVDYYATASYDPAGPLAVDALGGRCILVPPASTSPRATVVVPPDAPAAFALVRAVFETARERDVAVPPGHYTTHSDEMALDVGGGRKLGVGSSSAVAAALARLLLGASASADAVFALADAAHLRFSSGRGSGIDVAAAAYGGVCHYADRCATPAHVLLDGLTPLGVYVGHSQSTREFLDQVAVLKSQRPQVYASCLNAIAHAASTIARGLGNGLGDGAPNPDAAGGHAATLLNGIHAARAAMDALGRAAAIDIVSAPHQAVAQLMAAHGGAAKPSGAGGGDLAIAFVPQARAAEARTACADAGFVIVDVTLGAAGAAFEP